MLSNSSPFRDSRFGQFHVIIFRKNLPCTVPYFYSRSGLKNMISLEYFEKPQLNRIRNKISIKVKFIIKFRDFLFVSPSSLAHTQSSLATNDRYKRKSIEI